MEASFYPPRHLFKNHDNFDDKLENQHESLKRIATICDNLSECVIDCEILAVNSENQRERQKTQNNDLFLSFNIKKKIKV